MKVIMYEGGATFSNQCLNCGRFIKADAQASLHEPNATCRKCGRVNMAFIGYY